MEKSAKEIWVENFIKTGKFTSGDAAAKAFGDGGYYDTKANGAGSRASYDEATVAATYPTRQFFRDVAQINLGLYKTSNARFGKRLKFAA